jgi:hypothetical protein
MVGKHLPLVLLVLLFEDLHGHEFVGADLVERDVDAQLQRHPHVERPPKKESGFAVLGFVDPVQRAVVTPLAVRCVRTELGIAQVLAPEGPVDEIAEGRVIRPLRG